MSIPPDSNPAWLWIANPTRPNCEKLLQYIRTHYSELRNAADEMAEFLDEKALPFPTAPFEKAYQGAIEALQRWMDLGCDSNQITKEQTAVMHLAAWACKE